MSDYRKPDLSRQDELLREYEPFIRRTASFALRRIVSIHDDEYSVALSAFWDAAKSYSPDRGGSLKTYAKTVIRNRLIDYIRSKKKYDSEMLTDPSLFEGGGEEEDLSIQAKIENASAAEPVSQLAEEIQELEAVLERYDISFEMLPDLSPKAEKTRIMCARIVSYFSRRPDLVTQMVRTGKLPIAELERDVPCERKTLERYRKYIITASLIKTGDYPCLQYYLHGKGWEP
ncbi:MAG: sigma-70 family RNA polymerase sigma factor [Clostridia bacterium]|nr:sigma-70 family RNA polymerase sigma factor [Clostridia bacterium]